MEIIQLFVIMIVLGIAFWGTNALGSAFNIPAPIIVVVQVLLVILGLVWVLGAFGVALPGMHLSS